MLDVAGLVEAEVERRVLERMEARKMSRAEGLQFVRELRADVEAALRPLESLASRLDNVLAREGGRDIPAPIVAESEVSAVVGEAAPGRPVEGSVPGAVWAMYSGALRPCFKVAPNTPAYVLGQKSVTLRMQECIRRAFDELEALGCREGFRRVVQKDRDYRFGNALRYLGLIGVLELRGVRNKREVRIVADLPEVFPVLRARFEASPQ